MNFQFEEVSVTHIFYINTLYNVLTTSLIPLELSHRNALCKAFKVYNPIWFIELQQNLISSNAYLALRAIIKNILQWTVANAISVVLTLRTLLRYCFRFTPSLHRSQTLCAVWWKDGSVLFCYFRILFVCCFKENPLVYCFFKILSDNASCVC